MNTPQIWTVTPDQYQMLVTKAGDAGIPLTGTNCIVKKDGVLLEETYDGTTLTITIESRAWYDPSVADIQARIKAVIDAALAT